MNIVIKFFAVAVMFFSFIVSNAEATELSIPALEAAAGQTIEIPVIIDKIDNLAGVKLSMEYDPEILIFKKADKTKHTSSLMHIVNDKKPGFLIIVMAGAKGIKGEKFPVISMIFEVDKKINEKKTTQIILKDVQLMSDKLKDVQHTVSFPALTILPGKSEKMQTQEAAD
ncbi:Cohesin domain-containing protein [Desulfonema limicola]|uniref:Cohesin domain-containing protein n=1 Tax=Desulfonema limicola TaxID=45656 RepID=A0A975B842_9BACT|nr:cohesin domain-containing protein [Desulfonema limicola]QTA80330.1 Cohesin domain-containing protein [Desulfonema limicola]